MKELSKIRHVSYGEGEACDTKEQQQRKGESYSGSQVRV